MPRDYQTHPASLFLLVWARGTENRIATSQQTELSWDGCLGNVRFDRHSVVLSVGAAINSRPSREERGGFLSHEHILTYKCCVDLFQLTSSAFLFFPFFSAFSVHVTLGLFLPATLYSHPTWHVHLLFCTSACLVQPA